jgi:hypothetical protein
MKHIFTSLILFITAHLVQAQTIQYAGNLNRLRDAHESQVLNDGTVLVFGGFNGYVSQPYYYRSSEIYTRSSNSWTFTDSMAVARTDFASVVLNDGRVLAIGGQNSDSSYLKTCEWFDPATKKWSMAPSMHTPRSFHKAVMLKNGKVLVAGGYDNSCEIFDPATNQWTYTSPMANGHGTGMAMTKIGTDVVLALGGSGNPKKAELYNIDLGTWKATSDLKYDRVFSNIVAASNGYSAIVYGSTSSTGMENSELFTVNNGFYSTAVLSEPTSNSPGLELDNAKILTYGMGDFFSTNTKTIQLFDFSTRTWTPAQTSTPGVAGYTIHKLFTGEVLVSGGNATTGNGASQMCLLISPDYGTCSAPPNPALAVSTLTPTICYGKSVKITIANSESGVIYRALINSDFASYPGTSSGGSLDLTVPYTAFCAGKNIIRIAAYRTGCKGIILDQQVAVDVTQDNKDQPHLIVNGSLTTCSGTPLSLCSSIVSPYYIWSNNATTDSIKITSSGYYSLILKDANVCFSYKSEVVYANILNANETVSAGSDATYCSNTSPVQLTATPEFGTWSGPGVSPSGLFTPSSLTPGSSYDLTYTYCGKSDVKKVTIEPLPPPSAFYIQLPQKYICYYGSSVYVYGINKNATYELKVNGVSKGYGSDYNGGKMWSLNSIYTPINALEAIESLQTNCGKRITSAYDTLYFELPKNNVKFSTDTTCDGRTATIRVYNTETRYRYFLFTNYSSYRAISDTIQGNGDTLAIKTPPLNYTTDIGVGIVSEHGCFQHASASYPYPKVFVKKYDADFTLSRDGGWIGQSFIIKNKSTMESYTWNIDGTISNKVNPDTLKFTSLGTKVVKLVGMVTPGCYDSLTKKIDIIDPPVAATGTACFYDTIPAGLAIEPRTHEKPLYTYHVDKNGNKYVASSTYFSVAASYSGGYGLTLQKFDKDNNLIWEKRHNPYVGSKSQSEFICNFVSDIESDNSGNIYVAGHFGGTYWKWDNMELAIKQFYYANMGYLLKLDSRGIVQWVIHTEVLHTNSGTYECSFTDIEYVNDSTIYAGVSRPNSMYFPDGSKQYFENYDVNVITINKDGKLIKRFSAKGSSPYDGSYLLNLYNPHSSGYMYSRVMSLSPKIKLGKDGNIYVFGKSSKMLMFDALKYESNPPAITSFVAVLDPQQGWKKVFKLYSMEATTNTYLWWLPLPLYAVTNNGIFITDYYNTYSPNPVKLTIGGKVIVSPPRGSFTAGFDLNGNLQWHDSATHIRMRGIAALKNEVITYGSFENYYAVSPSTGTRTGVRSQGPTSAALTSYTLDGKVNWIERITNDTIVQATDMVTDRCSNNVHLFGLANTSSFLTDTLTSKWYRHYCAKYSPDNNCAIINCTDCAGVPNGTAFLDSCRTCAGGTTGITPVLDAKLCKVDCGGVINGSAFLDTCGTCVGGSTGRIPEWDISKCKLDCARIPGGKAFVDSCGKCAGGTTGFTPILDKTKCPRDCAGIIYGTAFLDSCKICAGGITGIIPTLDKSKCGPDCAGVMNGTAFLDSCKICAGGTTSIQPILDPKLCKGIGIEELKDASKLIVYPNPSSGKLFIHAQEAISEITVTNAIGESVFSASNLTAGMDFSIDISKLPDAVYFVVVKTKQQVYNRKITLIK